MKIPRLFTDALRQETRRLHREPKRSRARMLEELAEARGRGEWVLVAALAGLLYEDEHGSPTAQMLDP